MAAVCASISVAGVNPVLGIKPPEVDISEQKLPRAHRTTLNQLRSSKCYALRSYKHFIKMTNNDTCPNCHCAPQTTTHLFSCSSYPTTLTVWDLWYQPVDAAKFLLSLPTLGHFLPLLPPFSTTSSRTASLTRLSYMIGVLCKGSRRP
jgi:hypothetical protein